MAYGDDAQNTWDKVGEQTDPATGEQSRMEMPEGGFREHLGKDGAMLSGDMAGDEAIEADQADIDSDRDYDTDMEEAPNDAFTDSDSF